MAFILFVVTSCLIKNSTLNTVAKAYYYLKEIAYVRLSRSALMNTWPAWPRCVNVLIISLSSRIIRCDDIHKHKIPAAIRKLFMEQHKRERSKNHIDDGENDTPSSARGGEKGNDCDQIKEE